MGVKLPEYITQAIKCGPKPVIRNWRKIYDETNDYGALCDAEKIMVFAETYLKIPEGEQVGEPLRLSLYQEVFIYAVFSGDIDTAILSIARRNGKTFIIAVICLALLLSPLSVKNRVIASAAMSREQAALLFRAMAQMIQMSEELSAITKITPSDKRIICTLNQSEYYAMSADKDTGYGKSLAIVVLDESGRITAPHNDFVDMLATSQGSYSKPLFITISTQAPSDSAWLSQQIDDATRSGISTTVCHVYKADEDCKLLDKKQWIKANPGLSEGFRASNDIKKLAESAHRLPMREAGFRNLILNQRVALERLWLAPQVWKQNSGKPDRNVFLEKGAHLGLDLSQKHDLTAAVLCAVDSESIIHVLPFAFTPLNGIEERSRRDRVPYDTWARNGQLIAAPGDTIDYDFVAAFCRDEIEQAGINIISIQFDDWRISDFRKSADREGMGQCCDWVNVRQGFKSMTPRVEAMETALLQNRVRHGAHPVLNLGASGAIAVSDPTGGRKLDKTKAAKKIDALVAMLMAIYPCLVDDSQGQDISWWIM